MREALRYALNMIPYMLVALPFLLMGRSLSRNRLFKKGLESGTVREVWLTVFLLFVVGLLSQTLLTELRLEYGADNLLRLVVAPGAGGLNLRLFDVFRLIRVETLERGKIGFFLINFIGNIAVFMPVGFFVSLLWRRPACWKALCVGLGLSLFIEICQLPLARGTDVDDLWLNTLGALLGWAVYKLFEKKLPLQKCRVSPIEKGQDLKWTPIN